MCATRVILDFPAAIGARNAGTRRQLFEQPDEVLVAHDLDEVRPALRAAEQAARAGAHAVGFVAYEAAPAFDAALTVRDHAGPAPLLWFGIFRNGPRPEVTVGAAATATATATATAAAPEAPHARLEWRARTNRDTYDNAIRRIRAAIEAGDVYQVNYTLQLLADCPSAHSLLLYDALVAGGHGDFNALIETAGWSVISASPELFIDCAEGVLTARPMKGTHRRGRWLAEDRAAAGALAASAKDRAENLMIVDLLRNDLGRIAEFGSVQVPAMFDVESYPTLHQLTSTVTARLRAGLGIDDVFSAMFPCGSVTGAPKVAAMKTIAQLEHTPRGPYCGAIGVLRPDGSFTFNVAIRTLLLDRFTATASFGTGGGITWDSRAEDEFDELTAKAALVTGATPSFRLIETLRLDDVGYARLDGHLRRLAESARYWGFADSTAGNAAAALADERARIAASTDADASRMDSTAGCTCGDRARAWRVRLTAGHAGDIVVSREPLTPLQSRPSVCLADTPVSRGDRLLFHKTTARATYERHRAAHPDVFDVLLWNEEREVTEFTTGNVVALIDGALLTPPLDAGLLAGVLREQLLADGRVREAVVTVDMIRRARRVWFTNSVRGIVGVTLACRSTHIVKH